MTKSKVLYFSEKNNQKKHLISEYNEGGASCGCSGAPPSSSSDDGVQLGIKAHKKTELGFSKGFPLENCKYFQKQKGCSVDFYSDGIEVHGIKPDVKKQDGSGGKRGKIGGWSRHSRSRMRKSLIRHKISRSLKVADITLTVAGPLLPVEYQKRLWNGFQMKFRRAGCCGWWRKELQERGQVHWHMLAGIPPEMGKDEIVRMWLDCLSGLKVVEYDRFRAVAPSEKMFNGETLDNTKKHFDSSYDWVLRGVIECCNQYKESFVQVDVPFFGSDKRLKLFFELDSKFMLMELVGKKIQICGSNKVKFGRVVNSLESFKVLDDGFDLQDSGFYLKSFPNLTKWQGVEKRAVLTKFPEDQNGAWKRYIQDHATKSKQAQMVEDNGRHWGLIGRDAVEIRLCDSAVRMDRKAFGRFLRAYNKLIVFKSVKSDCVFGRKKAKDKRRGLWGDTVFFSQYPEQVRRLARWAVDYEC